MASNNLTDLENKAVQHGKRMEKRLGSLPIKEEQLKVNIFKAQTPVNAKERILSNITSATNNTNNRPEPHKGNNIKGILDIKRDKEN